jgi:hypothetical protein
MILLILVIGLAMDDYGQLGMVDGDVAVCTGAPWPVLAGAKWLGLRGTRCTTRRRKTEQQSQAFSPRGPWLWGSSASSL